MSSTTDAINAAIEGAEASGELPTVEAESVEDIETPEVKEPVVEGESEVAPKVEAKAGEEPKTPAADEDDDPELTKLLDEYGIKRAGKEQRDNRIPYSRTRKIIGKIVKKIKGDHDTAIGTEKGKLTAAEAKLQKFADTDAVIQNDPDRYMGLLALLHPDKYGRFVTPAEKRQAEKKVEAASSTPEPEADIKYQDGSVGYSPEQYKKHNDWLVANAVSTAKKEMEAEFETKYGKVIKPMQEQLAEARWRTEQKPRVDAQLKWARETYGDDFETEFKKDSESDIVKAMAADKSLGFEAACAKVLVPRIRANRNTMRKDILEEVSKRPAGAQKQTPGHVKATDGEPVAQRTTQQVINDALAEAGL